MASKGSVRQRELRRQRYRRRERIKQKIREAKAAGKKS